MRGTSRLSSDELIHLGALTSNVQLESSIQTSHASCCIGKIDEFRSTCYIGVIKEVEWKTQPHASPWGLNFVT